MEQVETFSNFFALQEFEKNFLPAFRELEQKLQRNDTLDIYCVVCKEPTNARIRSSVMLGDGPSLREGIICNKCNFNARNRLIYDAVTQKAETGSAIYLNEQHTPLANLISENYPNAICANFISDKNLRSGDTYHRRSHTFRFEDSTNTSFKDNSLEIVVSCDVLEHIPNYFKAMQETYRILKPGGVFLLQVPVFGGLTKHVVRAEIVNSEVIELLPSEMHGDPNSDKGVLTFYNFSYGLISDLLSAGFRDCRVQVNYSSKKGYFTDNHPGGGSAPMHDNWGVMLPVVFVATK